MQRYPSKKCCISQNMTRSPKKPDTSQSTLDQWIKSPSKLLKIQNNNSAAWLKSPKNKSETITTTSKEIKEKLSKGNLRKKILSDVDTYKSQETCFMKQLSSSSLSSSEEITSKQRVTKENKKSTEIAILNSANKSNKKIIKLNDSSLKESCKNKSRRAQNQKVIKIDSSLKNESKKQSPETRSKLSLATSSLESIIKSTIKKENIEHVSAQKETRTINTNSWLSKKPATKETLPKTKSFKRKLDLKITTKPDAKSRYKATKKTLTRMNSGSSDDLPTFQVKRVRKNPKQTESFKKYGIVVPSFDEILADKKDFLNYKNQVEYAQSLPDTALVSVPPTSPKKSIGEVELLDCKHLTLNDIKQHFTNNIEFLTNIINGKKYSERHRRFNDKNNKEDITGKSLMYNTSMIVFDFEQVDYMVTLMGEQFDPEDKKTSYFFKVLMPELCLKIFMDVHGMNKREANKYLDNRPI